MGEKPNMARRVCVENLLVETPKGETQKAKKKEHVKGHGALEREIHPRTGKKNEGRNLKGIIEKWEDKGRKFKGRNDMGGTTR